MPTLVLVAVICLVVFAGTMLILIPLAWKHDRKLGYKELERRFARARVPAEWRPRWAIAVGVGGILIVAVFDRLNLNDGIWAFILLFLVLGVGALNLRLRSSKRREFLQRLSQCNDCICPECLYSLEGTTGDGVCPECGTAYTDEGLHAAWAFLHKAEAKNQSLAI